MRKILIGLLLVVLASFAVTNTATAATNTMEIMEMTSFSEMEMISFSEMDMTSLSDFSNVLAYANDNTAAPASNADCIVIVVVIIEYGCGCCGVIIIGTRPC